LAGQVSDYSGLDRFLHRLAFSGSTVQRVIADLEDSMFGKQIAAGSSIAPIFVTSLPRAGTTILLTALASLPGLASHTYRDMPFVMAPMLWSRFSGSFQKGSDLKERAHRDGIQVGYDSPEAFEEILWRSFWPDKFSTTGIDLWTEADATPETREFFRKHFAKIVALRCPRDAMPGRYISKNNANIARLDLIPAMFPDADIVVPIREPMAHASSLLRQHLNFLDQHQSDAFTKRYMRDIGHLEFGELHRPIRFPGFEAESEPAKLSPETLDYWLAYWVAAFNYVKERRGRLLIVAHSEICNNGLATVQRIFQALNIDQPSKESAVASHFRPEPPRKPEYPPHDAELRQQAETLYQELTGSAASY
jgi:hypothetical protein